MNPHFPDWYRIAGVEPPQRLLTERWTGLEEFCRDLKASDVVELSKLFATSLPSTLFLQRFRLAFQTPDPTFSMEGNDVEVRVLAGASLAHLIQGTVASAELRDFAALTLVCDEFGDLRPSLVSAITRIAQAHLDGRSLSLRDDTDGFADEISIPPQATEIADGQRVSAYLKEVSTALSELSRRQRLHREESNVLWWSYSGWSRDLKKPFAKVSYEAASILLGKELADLVTVLPGPVSAGGVLSKALLSVRRNGAKSIKVCKAVNSIPREWRSSTAATVLVAKLSRFAPVLTAIVESSKTLGEQDWFPAFRMASDLDPEVVASPLGLAFQVYRECLLMRAGRALLDQQKATSA